MIRYFLIICALCCAAEGYGQQNEVQLGGGYYYVLKGSQSLLHVPGNAQLWRKNSGTKQLIWPYMVGELCVTNELVAFNGGLDDSDAWKLTPAIFVCAGSGPAVELTENLTKLYASRSALQYTNLAGIYSYKWPKMSNDVLTLTGNLRPYKVFGTNYNEWINLSLKKDELVQMANEVQSNGVKRIYNGADYFIQPSINR